MIYNFIFLLILEQYYDKEEAKYCGNTVAYIVVSILMAVDKIEYVQKFKN